MKIKREDLKKGLEIVKPGLASKEIIEQTKSFAFIEGKVVTYNDEISISHPIPGLDITGAVQSEELYKYISKLKEEEIDITIEETQIILKCGRATTGFALQTEIKLPLAEELKDKGKWQKLPTDFCTAINFASMSCSTDMSNPKLTCVHIDPSGFVEGCDNLRIAHYITEELPVNELLIPASSVKVIVKMNPVKIAEGNGWVHFKTTENTIISCRVLDDKYMSTSQYIKQPKNGNIITLPKTLSEVLDKAIIFSKREQMTDEIVEIEIKSKSIKVSAESEISWFKESIPIKYDGEQIVFSVTPYLLKDILKQTTECKHVDKLLYFKSDNWIYVASLKD